jgi:hypothetical protein
VIENMYSYRSARINLSAVRLLDFGGVRQPRETGARHVAEEVACGVILSGCGICLPKNLSAWPAQKKEGFFVVRLRRTPQNDTNLALRSWTK